MNLFLISFQVTDTLNQNNLINAIKKIGSWARITDTTYCIKVSNMTVIQIRDKLKSDLDESSRIIVVDISNSSWGSFRLPTIVTNWLKE